MSNCKVVVLELEDRNLLILALDLADKINIPKEPAIMRVIHDRGNCRITLKFLSGKTLSFEVNQRLSISNDIHLQLLIKFGNNNFVTFKSCYIVDDVIYLDYVGSI